MSSTSIAEQLRKIPHWEIKMHQDELPRGASDVEVIEKCAKEGWVLVSNDDRIRFAPESKEAAARLQVRAFMMVRKPATLGVELASALVAGHYRILSCLKKHRGGFFAHVYLSGNVQIMTSFDDKPTEPITSTQEKTLRKYGRI